MNTANHSQQPAKPTFSDLCLRLLPDPSALQDIADQGGISKNIVDAFFIGTPVEQSDAIAVLAVFSERVGETWTLDMVDVPLVKTVALRESKSEVIRLLQKIDAEYQSGWQAMHGFTLGTAQHKFITKRMENIAEKVEELRTTLGHEAAMEAFIAWQDQAADGTQNPKVQ